MIFLRQTFQFVVVCRLDYYYLVLLKENNFVFIRKRDNSLYEYNTLSNFLNKWNIYDYEQ